MSRLNRYVVIDLEMTGLSARTEKIMEIGAVRVVDGRVAETFQCLVNPGKEIDEHITELTGITNDMLKDGRDMDEALGELIDFLGEDVMVGHNVNFDYSFMKQWAINKKRVLQPYGVDTLKLARQILPAEQPKKLESLCEYFDIPRENAHRALDDAVETYYVYEKLCDIFEAAKVEIPASLPLIYHGKKQTPATKAQVERLKEYIARKEIAEEIDWGILTRSEASRIQDKFYAKYGR